MQDETYGQDRVRKLLELLRELGRRIEALKRDDELLAAGPQLMKLMGEARSELFKYEVRSTFDTPEVAESRRIVDEAQKQEESFDPGKSEDWEDPKEDSQWHDR